MTEALFFGGIYSNLEALTAVRKLAEDEYCLSPEHIYFNGDIAGYCADPGACVDLLSDWGINMIAGNVDFQLGHDRDDCNCNYPGDSACSTLAAGWYNFSRSKLSDKQKLWLKGLPLSLSVKHRTKQYLLTHGAPGSINQFIFPSEREKQEQALSSLDDGYEGIIAGHSGLPFINRCSNGVWANCGASGMPDNSGIVRGSYLTLDNRENLRVQYFTYDSGLTATKMRCAKLSEKYAQAFENGIWPDQTILPESDQYR